VNSGMHHRSDCRGALQVTVVTITVYHACTSFIVSGGVGMQQCMI